MTLPGSLPAALPRDARPIRVLMVAGHAASLRNFRGPLIKEMIARGLQVHVAAPGIFQDAETVDWLRMAGATIHEIDLARTGLSPLADCRSLIQLYRLMRHVRPGHFIGYTIKPVIWGLLAARLAGVQNRVALITGLGYAFSEISGVKHAVIASIARTLYRVALTRATLVFFQNPDDRAEFAQTGLLSSRIPAVVVNGSGVDPDAFDARPLPPLPMRFLLIARLLGSKGIREYAAASAKLKTRWPEAEFHLVGPTDPGPDGLDENEVRGWQKEGHVIWHGGLGDVRPAIAAAHVYVLPSYREGTPRTVLEAMSMGRPVITTDAPGCRETVVHAENGYLVPVRDVGALEQAMESFLHDPSLISAMGEKARAYAVEKYDVGKVNAVMLKAMGL